MRYIPNVVPKQVRVVNALFSLLIFVYGSIGILVNDLYIPGKRTRGVHLHDEPAWFMYGAMLCACAMLISVVVDHYDRRDNEITYKRTSNILGYVAIGLFAISLLTQLGSAYSKAKNSQAASSSADLGRWRLSSNDKVAIALQSTPSGIEYQMLIAPIIFQAHERCPPNGSDFFGSAREFAISGVIDRAGRLSSVRAQPGSPFSRCITEALANAQLPAPPAHTGDSYPLFFPFSVAAR